MPRLLALAVIPLLLASGPAAAGEEALRRALDYFAGTMVRAPNGQYGGWPKAFAAGRAYGTGEAGQPIPPDCVCIQEPATVAAGMTFLRAGRELGEQRYVDVARQVGDLLLAAMTPRGGWDYELWLAPDGPKNVHLYPGRRDWSKGPPQVSDYAVYDDGVTYAPAEFLYCLWSVTQDERYLAGWKRCLDSLVRNQLPGGGYPQVAGRGGYHAYATFNDGVMSTAVNTLLLAYRRTGDENYLNSVRRCGEFLTRIQSGGGGYATQYSDGGQIAGARSFEPPGLGPDATSWAIGILCDVYDWTGEDRFLAPVGKAAAWLRQVQTGGGNWARFYHPDSNRPWYRSESGNDVSSAGQAKPGYTWNGSWGQAGLARAQRYANRGPGSPRRVPAGGEPGAGVSIRANPGSAKFLMTAEQALAALTPEGAWPEGAGSGGRRKKGGGGGGGQPPISVGRFVAGVNALLDARAGITATPLPSGSAQPQETPPSPATTETAAPDQAGAQ